MVKYHFLSCFAITFISKGQLIVDYSLEGKIFGTSSDNVSYLSNEWILECFFESELLLKEYAQY